MDYIAFCWKKTNQIESISRQQEETSTFVKWSYLSDKSSVKINFLKLRQGV